MKYFLHLAYNGTNYRGYQRQPNVKSVQETIETTLNKMLRTPTTVFGCGRTDAEVHASQYFLHLRTEAPFDYDPIFRINKMLPDDIVVYEFIPVPETTNARYDAIKRSYEYHIHGKKDPFLTKLSTYYDLSTLNIEAMQRATHLYTQHEDFRSLCKSPDKHNHTRCTIYKAQLDHNPQTHRLRFKITANRFLRGLIRIMVGRLLEIGQNKITLTDLDKIIKKKEPSNQQTPAYPQGLYLTKIEYPYLTRPTQSLFAPTLYTPNLKTTEL